MTKMLKLPKNDKGRDFFVGDLHGCYELLMHHLMLVRFDKEVDRLISVGDLVDRGPSSEECVMLIKEPWFFAVKGNHEDMCVGVYRHAYPLRNYLSNGGDWFAHLTDMPERRAEIVRLMDTLPLFIEVPIGDETIGVLHGDCNVKSWTKFYGDSYNEESVLWGRMRISKESKDWVNDISAVVVGHTPLKKVVVLGNVVYIDTGAVYGGGLTIMESKDILKLVPLKKKPSEDNTGTDRNWYQDILSTEESIGDD